MLKEYAIAFVIVFVASLASSLAAAAIYNLWFAAPETLTLSCDSPDPNPPKINW